MATAAQVAANRANAAHSTGPRTAEGKARCAHNALKHGLLSEQAVLEREHRQEFDQYAAALREELSPQGAWEELLAERIIAQGWRLRRATWMETCVLDQTLEPAGKRDWDWRKRQWDEAKRKAKEKGLDPSAVPDPCPRPWKGALDSCFAGEALREATGPSSSLDVLRRYERAIERGMYDAMKSLQAARKARRELGDQGSRCHGPTSAAEGPVGKDRASPALAVICETNPIPAPHPGNVACPIGGQTTAPAPMECGGVCDSALDRAQPTPKPEVGLCETDPIPVAVASTEAGTVVCPNDGQTTAPATGESAPAAGAASLDRGVCAALECGGVCDSALDRAQPTPGPEAELCGTDPIQPIEAAGAVDADKAGAHAQSSETDPIEAQERRIAAWRAKARAMREEERRHPGLGVFGQAGAVQL